VVTEKAIYYAGNVYPYDVVLAFTKKRKSILLLFEKSFNDQRFSVTLELKAKESDALFKALETARMSHIKFQGDLDKQELFYDTLIHASNLHNNHIT
jgi:hypothetical protein